MTNYSLLRKILQYTVSKITNFFQSFNGFYQNLKVLRISHVQPVALEEILPEFEQIVIHNGLAHLLHQIEQEIKIMIARKTQPKRFISLEQMTNVRTGIVSTRVAIAVVINWRKVARIFCVFNHQTAVRSHACSVSCNSRRQNAVKHVDSANRTVDQSVRRTDAHQIARLVFRNERRREIQNMIHLSL